MKKYQGIKTVMARPMSKWEACVEHFIFVAYNVSEEDKNTQGYEVIREGGYHTWIPKEEFDKAYRLADSTTDRMKIELEELSERFIKLNKFMASDRFYALDARTQALLTNQNAAMDDYLRALRERLELMTGHPA